jgi:hypothetical protein
LTFALIVASIAWCMGTTSCHAAVSCRSRPAESSRPSGIDWQQYTTKYLLHCQFAFRPSRHRR